MAAVLAYSSRAVIWFAVLLLVAACHPFDARADNRLLLSILTSNSAAVVTWSNAAAVLQSAPEIGGGWSNVTAAASPYAVNGTNSAAYFRLYVTCDMPPSGIVSWWPADGSALDLVGDDNGTLMGGASYAAGEVREAFRLDGSSGWVDFPNSGLLNPTGPFTVECWVNGNPQQNYSLFLLVDHSHGWTDSTGWLLQGSSADGTVVFAYGLGGASSANFVGPATTNSVLDNRWHHLAGVWTGSQIQIYLDGVLQGVVPETSPPVNNARDVEIGSSWGGGTRTRYFNGLVDEVTYYNRALSANEIAGIFDALSAGKCLTEKPVILTQPSFVTQPPGTRATFSATAAGLLPLSYRWYKGAAPLSDGPTGNGSTVSGSGTNVLSLANLQFPDAGSYLLVVTNVYGSATSSVAQLIVADCVPAPSGIVSWWTGDDTAADRMGSNNGTLIGGINYTNGEVGPAFNLDGLSGYVDVPNPASLNPTGPFSVECWVNANPQQSYSQFLIVDHSHGFTDSTGWVLQGTVTNGAVVFAYGNGGGGDLNFPGVATTNSILDNQWHHLAGVWTGTQLQIYMDGVLQSTLAQTTPPVNNGRDVEIGSSWGGGSRTRYFHGQIDEVTYYNTALSQAQISTIYHAGIAGKCKP